MLGHDDVGDHKTPARAKQRVDPLKELHLAVRLEMVDNKSGEDEIERTRRERILDPVDAQLNSIRVEQSVGRGEHLLARVDSDQLSNWVHR